MGAVKPKYIYGPVSSWRLGRSLGIDILAGKKACSFDCIYCQAGKTLIHTNRRKTYVPVKDIIKEIRSLPKIKIDYITFSGRGEPTLAKRLGSAIKQIKRLRKEPVAVITNASLLSRPDVRGGLMPSDYVMVKLDACSEKLFRLIDRPVKGITLRSVIKGIRFFRRQYKGRLALQIMFIGQNAPEYKKLARMAKSLAPDEIQINTPLRPCGCRPLPKSRILKIKRFFEDETHIPVSCPFDAGA